MRVIDVLEGFEVEWVESGRRKPKISQIWGRRPDEGEASSGRRWQEGSVRGVVCVVRTKVGRRPDEGNRKIFFSATGVSSGPRRWFVRTKGRRPDDANLSSGRRAYGRT